MIEAKITLRNGKTETLMARDFAELGEYIEKMDAKKVEARIVNDIYSMRQGKETVRNMGGYGYDEV